MSNSLTTIGAIASSILSWRNNLRPASFRGVPFYTTVTQGAGGRRLVVHEFPERDDAYTEDLGRKAQRHRVTAFVVGDDYMDQRDALISACQDHPDAALLVHPYLGDLMCRAGQLSWKESQEHGGSAILDIEFVEDGPQPGPTAGDDTASALLRGIAAMVQLAIQAYGIASVIARDPAAVVGLGAALLGDAGASILGLPASTLTSIAGLAANIGANVGNDAATAAAVAAAFQSCASSAVAASTAPAPTDDPVAGNIPTIAAPADPSGGLAGLVSWGNSFIAPMGAGANQLAQAQQQQAIVTLVQGNALLAMLQVYAQIDWPTVNAADAARAQALGLIDAQAEAAALAGQDDLYRGWLAITGLVIADFIARCQNLPALAGYSVPMVFPSLALAQTFYQNASRAEELEAMNGVRHPLFMPHDGLRLSA